MPAPPTTRDQLERLLVLLTRARAFWKRGVLVFLIGVIAAVPYVFTRERQYKSETLILYHEVIPSDPTGSNDNGGDGSRRVGARLRELLLSRASLEPIIKDLELYPDKIIHGEYIGAVEEMRKNITFVAGAGDTYQIAFVAKTPALAQEVTRRLADCILHEASKRRTDQATTLKEFLTTESARNEVALKKSESDLASFLVLHPELAPKRDGQPATDKPVVLSTNADPILASLENRAARLERQLNFDAGAPPPPPKPFKAPPDSAELVAARRDLAEKQGRYTDKHPDVVAAQKRLKAAEQAQSEATQAAAAEWAKENPPLPPVQAHLSPQEEEGLRKELAGVRMQIAARTMALATATKDAGSAKTAATAAPSTNNDPVALAVELKRLQREVEDGRDRQQKLDQRLFQASIQQSSVVDDRNSQVSILDPAYLPIRPVSKSRTNLLAALLALSLFFGLALPIVSAILDDRLFDRRDIERLELLPVVGVIPKALPPGPK